MARLQSVGLELPLALLPRRLVQQGLDAIFDRAQAPAERYLIASSSFHSQPGFVDGSELGFQHEVPDQTPSEPAIQ